MYEIKREILDYNLCFEILELLHLSKLEAYDENSLMYKTMITDDLIKTNVNFDSFVWQEENNFLRVFTLRDENKKLVGHFTLTIDYHSQCKDLLVGTTHNIVIRKENRSYKIFKDLMRFAEDYLKNEGVSILFLGVPSDSKLNLLMEKIQYKETEVLYYKEL